MILVQKLPTVLAKSPYTARSYTICRAQDRRGRGLGTWIRRVRGHCWVAHQTHQGAASLGGREWSPRCSTQGYPKAPGAGEQWAKNPSLGGREAAGGKLPCELRLWAPRTPHCLIRLHLQSTRSKIKLLRLSGQWPQSSKPQAGYKVLWVRGPARLCWLPAYEAGSNSHKKICRTFSQSVWFWVINPINCMS